MSTKSNLLKNIGASSWGRLSTIVFKLIQVPLLLSFLSVEDFGRWLVIYSLPSWLAYANQGFGSVAANDIAISAAAGKMGEARKVYSTGFATMLGLIVIGLSLTVLIVSFVPWDNFLEIERER